jgi:hypothetical protein
MADDTSFTYPKKLSGNAGTLMTLSKARKCLGCGEASTMCCPTCKKLGLPGPFCSDECFKRSWKTHKSMHTAQETFLNDRKAKSSDENEQMLLSMEKIFGSSIVEKEKYKGTKNSQGQYHGRGKLKWLNGSIYDGDWENGKMCGRGVHRTFSGDVYEGDFSNNRMHGEGVYTWADGGVFTGSYDNDQMHGRGQRTWPSGSHHCGSYANNLRCGHGVMYSSASNTTYDGNWNNDLMHGHGKTTFHDGYVFEGEFENHNPVLLRQDTVAINHFVNNGYAQR